MARNGPGGTKTESRSPIIVSGVATPKHASTSIATVIATPATIPASKPAKSVFVLLIYGDLTNSTLQRNIIPGPLPTVEAKDFRHRWTQINTLTRIVFLGTHGDNN